MKRKHGLAVRLGYVLSLALVVCGCGDDSESGGRANSTGGNATAGSESGGVAGVAGDSATGEAAGTSGAAGSSGQAGAGGEAGSGDIGGSSGISGGGAGGVAAGGTATGGIETGGLAAGGTDTGGMPPGGSAGAGGAPDDGGASAEVCDYRDNNHDGRTDEGWVDLGTPCAEGVGACTRYGVRICDPANPAGPTICSAQPGPSSPEVCDYQDNDCDGVVDNGYRNPVTNQYELDTACGNCATDCMAIFGGRPNAAGVCVTGGTPTCAMVCNAGAFDMNASPLDGCELVLDPEAIYVSASDPVADDLPGCGRGPVGTGDRNRPCRSIARGLVEAGSTHSRLLIADGLYSETVTLTNGISLLGGYRPDTWERHLGSTLTVVRGAGTGTHKKTIIADAITVPTTIEGLLIEGPDNPAPGGNSYALWIRNSNANLVVRNNTIRGGGGGRGSDGLGGADGQDGAVGLAGDNAIVTAVLDWAACDALAVTPGNQGTAGDGGGSACGARGGPGAGATCPQDNNQEPAGVNGEITAGGGSAGLGGSGGHDRVSTNCGTFATGGFDATGMPGTSGGYGPWGTGGSGCPVASNAGAVIKDEWVATGATDGGNAGDGGGGGGGGAGGGADVTINCPGSDDTLGGSGGGGGGGGCAGRGAAGGSGGGGSFAVFVTFTAPAADLPVLVDNQITPGQGGNGGQGGTGGKGGHGGKGGPGGQVSGQFAYAMGPGGAGGLGGDGGHGGGGGGGCGGVAFGVYVHNALNPPLGYQTGNVFFAGGTGGSGGPGGLSLGTSGSGGATGAFASTNF
jgi:hypothetical protein